MAVEDQPAEDKSLIAMTTSLKHIFNGTIAIGKSAIPNGLLSAGHGKESNGIEDDELTSLAWLQDTNLLKNFQMGTYGIEGEDILSDTPSSDCLDDAIEHVTVNGFGGEQTVESLSSHSPYNPTLHASSKPPFSFSCLIFMAIEDSLHKALPVKDIYSWILTHFPYFQNAPTGWKNSVRHNLSLSKCFRKVEKEKGQNVGKGSLWCIDPEFRPNLIQALQKAPSMANVEFSNFTCMSPSDCQNGKSESEFKPCLLVSSPQALQIPSPELFPFLSRRLASSMKDPEVDAAATMLTLKNGPNVSVQNISEESESDSLQFHHRFLRKRLRLKQSSLSTAVKKIKTAKPVITTSPSEDHTYSACLNQPENSVEDVDEATWSENDKTEPDATLLIQSDTVKLVSKQNRNNEEEEGAHALMNLAEIASKRLLKKANVKSS